VRYYARLGELMHSAGQAVQRRKQGTDLLCDMIEFLAPLPEDISAGNNFSRSHDDAFPS
jgi:hypothetical protein